MSSNKKTQQKPKAVVKKPVQPKDHVCDFCGQKGTDLRGALYLCKVCAALEDSASSEPEAPKPKAKSGKKEPKTPISKLPDDACDWCDLAGAKRHGEDFVCDPCWSAANSGLESESESEPESSSEPEPPKAAQKRKVEYDVERYKKKMKELDLKPVEWKEHDMVKVDADGNFICADREKAKQFDELFKEQEDFCQDFGTVFMELEPEDADAMNFQFKHTIAQAANIVSNHIADTLGYKK